MYDFIILQYIMGSITEKQVRSYVPRWITVEQAEKIVASSTTWEETATPEEIAAAETERAAMSPFKGTYANQKATHHTCINSGVFRYLDNPHKHAPTVTFMASAGACLIW